MKKLMKDDYDKRLHDLLTDKKLILASNRGAYNFDYDDNGRLVEKRGGGGLVSAFLSLLEKIDLTWFSIARSKADKEIGLKGVSVGTKKHSTAKFVDVEEDVFDAYYNKMCNEVLWFVQHDLWDSVYEPVFLRDIKEHWEPYKKVNEKFADALEEELSSTAEKSLILFQDYHLYLASKYLPKNSNTWTAHFTHIPWPAPETMSILPQEPLIDILEGLLAHDLIGFHCQEYVMNFLLVCDKFLHVKVDFENQTVGFDGRTIPVGAFPISIDANALIDEAQASKVQMNGGYDFSKKKFIFRADRVDPSKNIIRGFLAFERLLEVAPDLRTNVDFVAYLYESRTDIQYYRDYLEKILETVSKINKRFGTDEWKPIHIRLADNYLETLAAYKHFDVLLVNSIADGMNLVAKEGPLLNTNDGVVVLSARTGAYNELSQFCLPINPFDVNETAKSLHEALTMSANDRAIRSALLRDIVRKNSSAKWLFHQLGILAKKDTSFAS